MDHVETHAEQAHYLPGMGQLEMNSSRAVKKILGILFSAIIIYCTEANSNNTKVQINVGKSNRTIILEGYYNKNENTSLSINTIYPRKLGKIMPIALGVDSRKNIYLADPVKLRILVYDQNGFYKSMIKIGDHEPRYPYTIQNIEIDNRDNVYVLTRHESKLIKLNSMGRRILSIPTEVSIQEGRQLHIDSNGNIYIHERGELTKYNNVGKIVNSWRTREFSEFFVDKKGNVYYQIPSLKWKKYNKSNNSESIISCENVKQKVQDPYNDRCNFVPLFIDDNYTRIYVTYKKSEALILSVRPSGETYLYELDKKDKFDVGYNEYAFDHIGNLYLFVQDEKSYRVVKYTFSK